MIKSETTAITYGEAASPLANMVGWKAGEGGSRREESYYDSIKK